jgi:hypothetical protein
MLRYGTGPGGEKKSRSRLTAIQGVLGSQRIKRGCRAFYRHVAQQRTYRVRAEECCRMAVTVSNVDKRIPLARGCGALAFTWP